MHIENVTINIGRESPMFRALLESLVAQPEGAGDAPVGAAISATPPRIGEYWQGQGGIYCGVARGENGQPDCHLVLASAEPASDLTWSAAGEWAKTVQADGHADFSLPTRFESALLYANVRDKLNTERWHWTGTQSSGGSAWTQGFDLGYQSDYGKEAEARARAVRRFTL